LLVFVAGITREYILLLVEMDFMNIFSSGWLQRMVDKAGATPASRIHALFQVLQDWVDVPGMCQQLQQAPLDEASRQALKAYLLQLLQASGVAHPDMVAGQVHMLLLGALNEATRQPGSQALEHAGNAALLLVNAQLPVRRVPYRNLVMAASVLLLVGALPLLVSRQPHAPVLVRPRLALAAAAAVPSPDRIAALYHLHDQIRSANCSYPQALMLAPEQRGPFLENVVDGNLGDLQSESMVMVSQLYQKVDCYYPPAAMLL
jgi:hypothetical protein